MTTSPAMEHAGRLLARRAYSRSELENRLEKAGYTGDVAAETLERLSELGLLNDEAFASEWVEQRARRKGLGPARLRAELEKKGIEAEVIEAALAADDDELERAKGVAASQLKKVIHLPLPRQASRLQGFLARRGFSGEAIEAAVRAVLPPEGWD